MHFDPIQVDVDGSLRNPYTIAAVVIWAALLTLIALRLLRVRGRLPLVMIAALLLAAGLVTPSVVRLLLNLAYAVTSGPYGSIGVIGGPPAWLPSLLAIGFISVVSVLRRKKGLPRAA